MLVTYRYPGFVGSYESRTANPFRMYDAVYGTAFHGTEATLMVNREGYTIYPNQRGAAPVERTHRIHARDERAALEELSGMHPHAPEAGQRNRNLRAHHSHLRAGQPFLAARSDARLGRQGIHRQTAERSRS